jgi:hypothetical protein
MWPGDQERGLSLAGSRLGACAAGRCQAVSPSSVAGHLLSSLQEIRLSDGPDIPLLKTTGGNLSLRGMLMQHWTKHVAHQIAMADESGRLACPTR